MQIKGFPAIAICNLLILPQCFCKKFALFVNSKSPQFKPQLLRIPAANSITFGSNNQNKPPQSSWRGCLRPPKQGPEDMQDWNQFPSFQQKPSTVGFSCYGMWTIRLALKVNSSSRLSLKPNGLTWVLWHFSTPHLTNLHLICWYGRMNTFVRFGPIYMVCGLFVWI